MKSVFRPNSMRWAICLAFPVMSSGYALATEPFPPLPPALSTSVTPNIMLYIDTSGSMLQDENNKWMLTNLCDSNVNWGACVNNNTNNYRTRIDSESWSPNTKMNIAKRVMRNLVDNNRHLRFGVFSFQDRQADIGGTERSQAGKLRAPVQDVSSDAGRDNVINAINGLYGRTATPLAEGLMEITRYFSGDTSLYGLLASGSKYTSPIQYRCQKNFVIVVTDGDATDDQNLPGSTRQGDDGRAAISSISYTARNDAGGAVSKSFSVCRSASATADDGMNVTCPSTYDSNATSRPFEVATTSGRTTTYNYPAAIRDVAMYANRADFRVGGTDADGKSFDDPKFALQNLITYTVGYAINNPVLPSAAKVGGGKYYKADNEDQLQTSLNNAISSIADLTSNAGGVATKGDSVSSGNKVFQPVFTPSGWYGELRCYDLSASGVTGLGEECKPNAKGVIPNWSSRTILSNKVDASGTTSFVFAPSALTSMTAAQKAALGSDANSEAERKNVIDFLRGNDTITGFRRRPNGLLGDIIASQPLSVAAPTGNTPDTAYAAFKTAHASRGLVFIGANDGMLHGFRMSDMNEFMGYIPSAVYPRLKALKETDYGQSAGTPHVFHVNGPMRQADIKVGANWMTMLVGGLAQGGQGYFALNVTDEATAKQTSAVKWEWTDVSDKDMGYSFGAPVIYNVRTSATTAEPAVILVNGYENDHDDTATGGQQATAKSSALYVIKAGTGELLKKITLPAGSQGLSAPAGVDYGQDGVLDYVYAGDVNGNLWRFDMTSNTPAGFKVVTTPIFVASNTDGTRQPITIRPAILGVSKSSDGSSVGNLVMFGTGKLLQDADRTDATVQSFYAILDNMSGTPTTVTRSQLVARTVLDTKSENRTGYRAGTYRQISTLPKLDLTSDTNTQKGWFLDLPDKTERLVTSPLLLVDKLLFGTGVPEAAEKCVPGGRGWIMGLNPLTGSVTASRTGREYSFVDVKLDGTSTDADKLGFASGNAFVSGFATEGIPTELTYISQSTRLVVPTTTNSGLGDAGSVIAMQDANSMAVHTGNAGPGGVTTGNPIARPEQSGKGNLIHCVQGQPNCDQSGLNAASSGVKVETTLWREIK